MLFVARVHFYRVHDGGKVDVLYWFYPRQAMGTENGMQTDTAQTGPEMARQAYKKAHLGTALKANPFGGVSHAKGIVPEKL